MTRYVVDCRQMPSTVGCTLRLSADSPDELLEAAAKHAVQVHEHEDTPELRAELSNGISSVRSEPVTATH